MSQNLLFFFTVNFDKSMTTVIDLTSTDTGKEHGDCQTGNYHISWYAKDKDEISTGNRGATEGCGDTLPTPLLGPEVQWKWCHWWVYCASTVKTIVWRRHTLLLTIFQRDRWYNFKKSLIVSLPSWHCVLSGSKETPGYGCWSSVSAENSDTLWTLHKFVVV